MKLAKPTAPSNDARFRIEQEIYLSHCQNIATILAASFELKINGRQELVDQYLEAVNTATEP
jgi:hypothetical protein